MKKILVIMMLLCFVSSAAIAATPQKKSDTHTVILYDQNSKAIHYAAGPNTPIIVGMTGWIETIWNLYIRTLVFIEEGRGH